MLPFTEAELQAAYERWVEVDARLADILLVLGWTGLRWAEARALTVAGWPT
jgi:integrase